MNEKLDRGIPGDRAKAALSSSGIAGGGVCLLPRVDVFVVVEVSTLSVIIDEEPVAWSAVR